MVPLPNARKIKIQMEAGDVLEWTLGGNVEKQITDVMYRKHEALVLKLVGAGETTFLNTKDIAYMTVMGRV